MTHEIDAAHSAFSDGFSCSQAILSSFSEGLGLDRTTALRISSAFGGGIAGRGLTCGAVTGALMVIGLRHGRIRAEDTASKEKTYELSREFIRRFTERHGSTVCRDLLGVDISTPEGKQRASDEGLSETRCPAYVRSAAEILTALL
jgi:C_GCAxxG_C_C family probable redox protein